MTAAETLLRQLPEHNGLLKGVKVRSSRCRSP